MALWESPKFWYVALAAGVVLGIYGWRHAPYAQRLPTDVSHLDELEPALKKLPTETERKLVLGYLARSHGDVLTPGMADPDAPFTARTFGQAISLKRQFLAQEVPRQAKQILKEAQRQVALSPLRAAVAARLLRRELLTNEEIYGGTAPAPVDGAAKRAIDDRRMLVTTFQLRNMSGQDVTAVQGTMSVRNDAGVELDHCWVDHSENLPARNTVEVRCGSTSRAAGEAGRAYAALPASDLTLVWEPQKVVLGDGTTLKVER